MGRSRSRGLRSFCLITGPFVAFPGVAGGGASSPEVGLPLQRLPISPVDPLPCCLLLGECPATSQGIF